MIHYSVAAIKVCFLTTAVIESIQAIIGCAELIRLMGLLVCHFG